MTAPINHAVQADHPELRVEGPPRKGLPAIVGVALLLTAAIATPFARIQLFPLPGYMLAFGTAMVATNLILAALLFSRGTADRDRSSMLLGAIYCFVAIIFIPLMMAFPGAVFGPEALIGTTYSPIWLWTFWHGGFGLGIVGYAINARRRADTSSLRAPCIIALLIVLTATLAIGSTLGIRFLPAIFGDPAVGMFAGNGQIPAWMLLAIDVIALVGVFSLPNQTSERLWLSVAMVAACFDVWLTFHAGARYSVGWYLGKVGSLTTTMVVLVSFVNDVSALYRKVQRANATLADLASRDGLTGIANRRQFDEVLSSELRRAPRSAACVALLMLDVDHFKKYNDALGHQMGDDCLRQIASVLSANAKRPGDLPARYGGEEFALVLPATDKSGAARVAERIFQELKRLDIPHPGSATGRVTVSVGIASTTRADPQDLIRQADDALYRAKAAGRDRIVLADGSVSPVTPFLPQDSNSDGVWLGLAS